MGEELRESEGRFRPLVQGVKDYAVLMLDPTGHVTSWNEGAQRIKGWTAEEILGRSFEIFYPPEVVAAGQLAPASVDHMRLLQGRVRRLEALIEGILAFSRVGRIRREIETVDTGAGRGGCRPLIPASDNGVRRATANADAAS